MWGKTLKEDLPFVDDDLHLASLIADLRRSLEQLGWRLVPYDHRPQPKNGGLPILEQSLFPTPSGGVSYLRLLLMSVEELE